MSGRVFVITGAFGVLGSAVARAAAQQGARLALIDFAPGPPASLRDIGETLVLAGVDLTDAKVAQTAINAAAERFGGLDVLVNVAGGFRWEQHDGGDPETWRAMFRMNVETAANASRAALPFLRRSPAGRIVNVGALGALKAAAGMGAYAAAKSGVHRLTEALAEELKATDVTVNAVLPSIIDTPTNRADMPDADPSNWVVPADLAEVILFLASEQSRAVRGALVPVAARS